MDRIDKEEVGLANIMVVDDNFYNLFALSAML